MAKELLQSLHPRDSDTPGNFDLRLNLPALARRMRGAGEIERLRHKHGITVEEVLRTYTPGAYRDAETGKVEINHGYDKGEDEGRLEALIWVEVLAEVLAEVERSVAR